MSRRAPRSLVSLPRRLGVLAALLGVLAPQSAALAQDAAAAEALFKEAKALSKEEKWEQACPKFEASLKLDKTLGTVLNLADCYAHIGKVASAWARWEEGVQLAERANDKDRADFAREERDKLTPRLSHLTIQVKNPVNSLQIMKGTTEIVPAMFGQALPVDPGELKIYVRRDEEILKTETVRVAETQAKEIEFDLAAIEKAAPPPKKKDPVVVVGASPGIRKAGWGLGAAGVGGLAAAGALLGVAAVKKSEADQPGHCRDKVCTPTGAAIAAEGATFAEIGQWVGIGSAALVAVGATILIITPSVVAPAKDKTTGRVWVAPWIDPSPRPSGGLVLGAEL